MNDPYVKGVRQVEPDRTTIEAAHENMTVTVVVPLIRQGGLRCRHDNNWPHGEWCGGLLTRHIDGGYAFCEKGHKFAL